MAIELAITAETLPEGACSLIASEQDRLNLYADYMKVSFPSTITGIEVGEEPPTDFDKAWLKLDNLGRPERVYYYANGLWLSLHPMSPGMSILWFTTLPDLNTYDGGAAGAVTAYAGPMWEEVTEMRARFPMGVGTLPVGGAIAVAATGGAEQNTLAEANIPEIQLGLESTAVGGTFVNQYATGTAITARAFDSNAASTEEQILTEAFGQDPPMAITNLPPYVAVYALRRTNRLFYRGA